MNEATSTKCLVALTEGQLYDLSQILESYRRYLDTGISFVQGEREELLLKCKALIPIVDAAIIPRF